MNVLWKLVPTWVYVFWRRRFQCPKGRHFWSYPNFNDDREYYGMTCSCCGRRDYEDALPAVCTPPNAEELP